ncbi:hypothetical protein CONPUDRAFT_77838 [Coniophora puteana RWD-64-598 SS2]|uniref:Uncharacterized protein n=1 Tax=Coniophora puteana (strain RWD-64-598) TaxID=741705 RepID=R7SEC5_CONPW|nr:uncharacterized protein CONPUDRAFT_77838 [Coniophora puteana RWD-64-598 SS2]EIW74536.1 hypothetical protein CONPUDRAFT_77838 [Coniophora puteana RWD-64-598 SS2]
MLSWRASTRDLVLLLMHEGAKFVSSDAKRSPSERSRRSRSGCTRMRSSDIAPSGSRRSWNTNRRHWMERDEGTREYPEKIVNVPNGFAHVKAYRETEMSESGETKRPTNCEDKVVTRCVLRVRCIYTEEEEEAMCYTGQRERDARFIPRGSGEHTSWRNWQAMYSSTPASVLGKEFAFLINAFHGAKQLMGLWDIGFFKDTSSVQCLTGASTRYLLLPPSASTRFLSGHD